MKIDGTFLIYLGDVVFAISGALAAGRHRMDLIGFILIGTITGIGGGTIRDIILGRPVFWITNTFELILCLVASLITFFVIPNSASRIKAMTWFDAIGLSAFAVAGCHIALTLNTPLIIAVFMGVMTATGGGIIRDILCGTKPFIVSGEIYVTAAFLGALVYALLINTSLPSPIPGLIGFFTVLLIRGAGVIFNIRMGPPGEFITVGKA
jgi:uncharacterized membrane protein YeiH